MSATVMAIVETIAVDAITTIDSSAAEAFCVL